MVRVLLGDSDGEERSTGRSLRLFISVTAETHFAWAFVSFSCLMEVSRVPFQPINTQVLIFLFTRPGFCIWAWETSLSSFFGRLNFSR